MKKNELFVLFKSLNTLGALKGVKFAYAVTRNVNLLKSEVEALEKASAPDEEYSKFEKERIKLAEEHANKDEEGKAIVFDNKYDISDNDKFETELETLKEGYKEAIEKRKEQIEEFSKILEEEADVKLYKVALADVPADISTAQMFSISQIVEE